MPKTWWLMLLGILCVAVGVRFFKLGQMPRGLYWDEVAILADAKVVSSSGQDMHGNPGWQVMFPSYGDYKLPVYIWLSAFSVRLLGVTALALRFPSAVAGVFSVIFLGFIARELWQQTSLKTNSTNLPSTHSAALALICMAVVAVTPWSVQFSRTGFESHLGQALVLISAWLVLKKNRWHWWWLAIPIGAVATYAYFSVRFVWPVVFIVLLTWSHFFSAKRTALSLLSRKFMLPFLTEVVTGLVIYMICLIPMFQSPLYQASTQFRLGTTSVLNSTDYALLSNQYREIAGNTVFDRIFFHRYWLMVQELLANFSDHLDLKYLFFTGDSNLRHGTGIHGVLPSVWLPFFVLGWYVWWKRHPLLVAGLLAWWLVAVLPASVPESTPHALRSLNGLAPVILVVSAGFFSTWEWCFSKLKPTFYASVILSTLILGIVASSSPWWYHYLHSYQNESADDWQAGYIPLTKALYTFREDGEPVQILQFDYRYYLWLLTYGPYTAQDILSFEHPGFTFQDFDQIQLDFRDQSAINGLIVGTQPKVTEWLTNASVTVTEQRLISGSTPETSYAVMRVKPKE